MLIGSAFWFYKLYDNLGKSVWDCYASPTKEKNLPSFEQLPGYKNITYAFENVCAHGMILCAWLILSALGSIILIKLPVGEKLWKGLLLGQIVLAVLALGWLANATYLRFSHAAKVCSGDYLDKLLIEDWGFPGPYIVMEGNFQKT